MNQLRQGNHSADEYVASFRELKDDTRYNSAALIEKFEQGLNPVLLIKSMLFQKCQSLWIHGFLGLSSWIGNGGRESWKCSCLALEKRLF